MKNKRHWIVYLGLLGCCILIFVYQSNVRPISPISGKKISASEEEIASSFHSAATGSQFSGNKIRTFSDFVFGKNNERNILSASSITKPLPQGSKL